jgi:hypothetical protein
MEKKMKIQILRTMDESIQIRFVDEIIYELEFFDDGEMVFCKNDDVKDIKDTKELFRCLDEIITYNKTLSKKACNIDVKETILQDALDKINKNDELVLICPLHRLMCTGCNLSTRIPRSWVSETLNNELDYIDEKYNNKKL